VWPKRFSWYLHIYYIFYIKMKLRPSILYELLFISLFYWYKLKWLNSAKFKYIQRSESQSPILNHIYIMSFTHTSYTSTYPSTRYTDYCFIASTNFYYFVPYFMSRPLSSTSSPTSYITYLVHRISKNAYFYNYEFVINTSLYRMSKVNTVKINFYLQNIRL